MIPHLCLDTLSHRGLCHSTAKVLLRHRWDGVLGLRLWLATMLLRYRRAGLVGSWINLEHGEIGGLVIRLVACHVCGNGRIQSFLDVQGNRDHSCRRAEQKQSNCLQDRLRLVDITNVNPPREWERFYVGVFFASQAAAQESNEKKIRPVRLPSTPTPSERPKARPRRDRVQIIAALYTASPEGMGRHLCRQSEEQIGTH